MDSHDKPRPRVISSLSIPRPRAKTPVTSTIPKPTSTPPTPSRPKQKPVPTQKSSNPRLAQSPNKSTSILPQKGQREEPRPALSLKEVIAQRRAEARKLKSAPRDPPVLGDDTGSAVVRPKQDTEDLGRWSLRETIERARTTGSSVDPCTGLAVDNLRSAF